MFGRARSALPWHARLEARVLLAVATVAAVSLATMLVATRTIVTRYSLSRSADDLSAARTAFAGLVETRRQTAAKAARLIVELPTFRASLTAPEVAADPATINQMTTEYCAKLGAAFCVVTDAAGRWLGRTTALDSRIIEPRLTQAVQRAQQGRSDGGMMMVGDALFLVVTEPAYFGREVVGTFSAGYPFDDRVATELAAVTHSDVTFLCRRTCGTSLTGAPRQAVEGFDARTGRDLQQFDGTPQVRTLGHTAYVGGLHPLDPERSDLALLLLKDWTPTATALRSIDTTLWWVTAFTLCLAFGGTVVFGRRVTRPIRDLAAAATEIAAGHWQRHVPPRGPLETRRMADAFNHMTAVLKQSHEEVHARTDELEAAYSRFRAITDSAKDAIVSADARGRIVFWNPGAVRLFGHPEGDAIGQPLSILVPDELRPGAEVAFGQVVAGTSEWLGRSAEVRARRRDGTAVAVEVSLATWTAGAEMFVTGIVRDVTERHEAARAIRDREEQLQHAQRMEAVGRLAGGVAHDFNNLLTAILGYTDLLLDQTPAAAPTHPHLREIQKAGQHAATLTKDLLAFSRKQVLQPVVVDLNATISSAEGLVRRIAGESAVLEFALASELRRIRADPGQLTQVLLNLVSNARDAMPERGRITVATQAHGDDVRLIVSDTGIGMSEEVRSHIFEPFFTTKGVGKGTGLGLPTVYGIVQQTGGRIEVQSEPGRGTTFTLSFPGTDAPVASTVSPSEPRIDVPPAGATILLVEDNEAVRAMARQTLTGAGYAVIEAPHGAAALDAVQGRLDLVDAVVTDVVMPVMGGRELVTRLRALRPDLCVVFTSGYASDPGTALYARSIGAAFLQKPFVPPMLRRRVREALDASRASGERTAHAPAASSQRAISV